MGQFDEVSQSIFVMLNVASVTDLLSTFDGQGAIFYERAPNKNIDLPYIVFSDVTGTPLDTHDREGNSPMYQVSCFARKQYDAEAIMSEANAVLHHQTPTLVTQEGHKIFREAGPRNIPVDEEEIFHVNCDYRINYQEI